MALARCALLASLTLLAIGACVPPPPAMATRGDVTVTADLAIPLASTRSVMGLLHGLSTDAPAAAWIDPLRPALWRGNLLSAPFTRATAGGARYMLVVSDLWGYPGEGWRGRGPP
jgi:hypothetical protein